jgi:glucosylceramidase
MRAWTTSKERKFEETKGPQWRASTEAARNTIRLDPSERYQEILGFGAAFTDASCYLLDTLRPQEREALLADLYSPSGLCLSVGRTCIGASDYSTRAYSFDESSEPDPDLQRFSIEHDRGYILPTLRAARHLNPDLFLVSSPWSPPAWM